MSNNSKDKTNATVIKIFPYRKSKELGRIIGKEGTMELLNLLEEKPRRYVELNKLLKMLSQSSLSRRLKILQDLTIIKQYPARSKQRDTHVYNFTARGELLMNFLKDYEKEIKLPLSQQKIIEIEKKYR